MSDHDTMASPRYRIEPCGDRRGFWQVRVKQRPDGRQSMWFDAGDPVATEDEAIAKLQEFQREAGLCEFVNWRYPCTLPAGHDDDHVPPSEINRTWP